MGGIPPAVEVLTAQVAQGEHLDADINGEILDYHEDMEGDQVEAKEPDKVIVYATHEQMEASQTTGANSPLKMDLLAEPVLDLEPESDSENTDEENMEPETCASRLKGLAARLGVPPPPETWTKVGKKKPYRSAIRVTDHHSPTRRRVQSRTKHRGTPQRLPEEGGCTP